jgi:hydrogenase maturation protease
MDKVLILGFGNILLQDEGLGVRALELLRRHYQLPSEVELCDGGCLGLELLPHLEGVTRLLLVDAAEMRKEPGTIARLEGHEVGQRWSWKLSAHEIALADLLSAAALLAYRFDKIVLYAMQPASIVPGLELSPPVQAALPRLVRMLVGELAQWGVAVQCAVPGEASPVATAR